MSPVLTDSKEEEILINEGRTGKQIKQKYFIQENCFSFLDQRVCALILVTLMAALKHQHHSLFL